LISVVNKGENKFIQDFMNSTRTIQSLWTGGVYSGMYIKVVRTQH